MWFRANIADSIFEATREEAVVPSDNNVRSGRQ